MYKNIFITHFKWKTLVGIFILTIGLFYLQWTAESLIANFLKRKLPTYIHYSYDKIEANIYSGQISLKNVHIDILNRNGVGKYARIKLKELKIDGFSYWKLWFMNTIHAKSLQLDSPVFLLYADAKLPSSDSERKGVVDLKRKISLGNFNLSNGSFYMVKNQADSLFLAIKNINLTVTDAYTDKDIIRKRIPIEHQSHELSSDSIFVQVAPYTKLSILHIELKNQLIRLNELALLAKYSPEELAPKYNEERDKYVLRVPSIQLSGVDYGFKNDTFFLSVPQSLIHQANLRFRLDKRRAHDPKTHDLYNKTIRELPIHLTLDSIAIVDSKILYEEKRADTPEAGYIFFDSINASARQLSNTYPVGEKTQINASSLFMGNCPVTLDWRFDVNSPKDAFLISGTAKNFNATSVNQFLKYNEKVKAIGTVDEFYFTARGDKHQSEGQVKMKYQDFTFKVLKDDYEKVKRVVTTIGNMLINNGGKTDENGYRHGIIAVERDPEKSFFNYLWVNIRNGLKNTMLGNGKKEE